MNVYALFNKPWLLNSFDKFLDNASESEYEEVLINPEAMQYAKEHNLAPKAVKGMTGLLHYVDEQEFNKVISKCQELVQDHVFETVNDWEIEDNYYYDFLRDQGHVDSDGDIDWDNAPTYADYNNDARIILDHLTELFEDKSIDYWMEVAKEVQIEYAGWEEDEGMNKFMVTNLPDLIAHRAEFNVFIDYCENKLFVEIDRSAKADYMKFKVSEVNSN